MAPIAYHQRADLCLQNLVKTLVFQSLLASGEAASGQGKSREHCLFLAHWRGLGISGGGCISLIATARKKCLIPARWPYARRSRSAEGAVTLRGMHRGMKERHGGIREMHGRG
jgi:hypothetical protein